MASYDLRFSCRLQLRIYKIKPGKYNIPKNIEDFMSNKLIHLHKFSADKKH